MSMKDVENNETKKEFKNEIKKKNYSLYGFIVLLVVSIPLTLLFVGNGGTRNYNNMTLEEYLLDTYSGNNEILNFVYVENVSSYDDIQVTDFETTDLEISEWEKKNFTGTVERNEIQHTYSLDDSGNVVENSPMIHEYTNRMLIFPFKVNENLANYDNIMYNNAGELDVDIDFFANPSNYGVITKKPDESTPHIMEYVQYFPSDSYMNLVLDTNADTIIHSEKINIDNRQYVRYVFNMDLNINNTDEN